MWMCWCDPCILAAPSKGICGVLQVFIESGRDVKGLEGCGTLHANPCCLAVFRKAFARPQKRMQWFLCHHLLLWLAPEIPALFAIMGNCSWKRLSQQPGLTARTNQSVAAVLAQDHCLQTSKRVGMLVWEYRSSLISLFELGPIFLQSCVHCPAFERIIQDFISNLWKLPPLKSEMLYLTVATSREKGCPAPN